MGCGGTKILDLRDVYDIGEKLGAGAFGQVRVATHKQTKMVRAVKVIWKEEQGVTLEELMEEIYVMRLMDHPLIVHLYDFFEDEQFLYTIIDSYTGGELFAKLSSTNLVKEFTAARYIRQMIEAVQYLARPEVSVVHRDIKPENFLLKDKTPESDLCMIDFGLSQRIVGDEWLSVCCGTVQYLSPEQIKGKYRFTADMWAVGVIGYLLIYGKFPFSGSSDSRTMYEIMSTEPNFKSKSPSQMSQDFLQQMLVKDPNKRLTPKAALEHKWLKCSEADLSGQTIDAGTIKEAEQQWQLSCRVVNTAQEKQRDQEMQDAMGKAKSGNKARASMLKAPGAGGTVRASLMIPGAQGPTAGGANTGNAWTQGGGKGGAGTLGVVPGGTTPMRGSFLGGFRRQSKAVSPMTVAVPNLPPPPKNAHRDENFERLALNFRKSNSVTGDSVMKQVEGLEGRSPGGNQDSGAAARARMSLQVLPSEAKAKSDRTDGSSMVADQYRSGAQLKTALTLKDIPESRKTQKDTPPRQADGKKSPEVESVE